MNTAAEKQGLPLAEWARAHLVVCAKKELGTAQKSSKRALASLFSLNLPIGPVDKMIEDSFQRRHRRP